MADKSTPIMEVIFMYNFYGSNKLWLRIRGHKDVNNIGIDMFNKTKTDDLARKFNSPLYSAKDSEECCLELNGKACCLNTYVTVEAKHDYILRFLEGNHIVN